MQRGRFITFDGADGAGKTTQIKLLSEYLAVRGIDHITTREPGGSPLAEKLREILIWDKMSSKSELLLMFTARSDHVENTIEPALAAGKWVICDRFVDSTFAYQGGGRGYSKEFIQDLYKTILNCFAPDLTLMLDVPPDVTAKRLAESSRAKLDKFESEPADFAKRIRDTFLEIEAEDSRRGISRITLIDANRSVGSVAESIRARVDKLITAHLSADYTANTVI